MCIGALHNGEDDQRIARVLLAVVAQATLDQANDVTERGTGKWHGGKSSNRLFRRTIRCTNL